MFFGADSCTKAKHIIFNALNLFNFDVPRIYFPKILFKNSGTGIEWSVGIIILIPLLVFFIFNDAFRKLIDNYVPKFRYSVFIIIILLFSVFQIIKPDYSSPFIYFNF